MDPIELLQKLLTELEAQNVDDGKKAWKALQKVAGDVVKPWAPMLTFKLSWCPPPNALLQRGLAEGGALRTLVEATVKQHPRELWEPVQEVPLKGMWWMKDRRLGSEPRLLTRQHGKSFSLYDPRNLSLVEVLKPSSLTQVVFAEDGGLRAMEGTRVLTRGPGETKWKKVHDFEEASSAALSPKVAAVLQSVVTGEGDHATEHFELHVFVFETGIATAFRLEGADFSGPLVAGSTVLTGTLDGKLFISEQGGALVERALPSGHVANQLVELDGTRWLCTWVNHRAGAWRRLDDLTESAWGSEFEDPQVVQGAMWSRTGERFSQGTRSRPVWFDLSCRGVMALSDRELVALRCDVKDKDFLVRFKRFS